MAPALPVPSVVRDQQGTQAGARHKAPSTATVDALQRELFQQRQLLQHFEDRELPALRMEIAFLRADLHALHDAVGSSRARSRARSEAASGDNAVEEDLATDTEGGFDYEKPGLISPRLSGTTVDPCGAHLNSLPLSPVRDLARNVRGPSFASMGPRALARTELVVVDAMEQGERKYADGVLAKSSRAEVGETTPLSRRRGRQLLVLSFEPNIWDCAVMCALYGWRKQAFGVFNVVMSYLLLVVNIVVQFLYVMIMVTVVVGSNSPQERESMLNYRLLVGHSLDAMDSRTLTSRIYQVCHQKWYDQVGVSLANVEDYLNVPTGNEVEGYFVPGHIVCLLAMFTWIVSIYSEFRRLSEDLLLVILSLPISSEVQTEVRGAYTVIIAVPRSHKAFCMAILLSRAIIAMGLLGSGLCFLVSTKEVVNLLTNAVALEFVRRIDELLFEAIVPRKLMGYVKAVKIKMQGHSAHFFPPTESAAPGRPRPEGPAPGMRLQNSLVLVRLLYIYGILVLAYWLKLVPAVAESQELYENLCGSNLDFVFKQHPVTGVPVFASLNPYDDKKETVNEMGALKCFFAATHEMLRIRAGFDPLYSGIGNDTLRSLINGTSKLCKSNASQAWTPCLDRDVRVLSSMSLTTWDAYFHDPSYCQDEDVIVAVLRSTCLHADFVQASPELAFFEDVRSCADLAPECSKTRRNSSLAPTWQDKIKKLCRVTCGACTY